VSYSFYRVDHGGKDMIKPGLKKCKAEYSLIHFSCFQSFYSCCYS